jgi:hypothetical protein
MVAMVVQVRHQVKPHHKHLRHYMHAVRDMYLSSVL